MYPNLVTFSLPARGLISTLSGLLLPLFGGYSYVNSPSRFLVACSRLDNYPFWSVAIIHLYHDQPLSESLILQLSLLSTYH